MKSLRVGVWLLENYSPSQGGGYGYYNELISNISNTKFKSASICFIGTHTPANKNFGMYEYFQIREKKVSIFLKLIDNIGRALHLEKLKEYSKRRKNFIWKENYSIILKICDIIYYPVPFCRYENFPFIYTLWDLGHMSSYAYPELTSDGYFETRKNEFEIVPFKALMVFVESETGKAEVIKYLGLNELRIRIFPLFPSSIISPLIGSSKPAVLESNTEFIHYPAQFWAHKNHYNLLLAFKHVLRNYPNLKLILTGSDKGNKSYIEKMISENDLTGSIIDLGFISIEELKWLYLHSLGLIMPTCLGPTNMPPLEALALGCPVAVSDIPGHHEQLGENAIYFNPFKIDEISAAIEKLICTRSELNKILFNTVQSNMVILDQYFAELIPIRCSWE
jgi:glycosyltransferase involved in cell wall biosynthesis